MVFLSFQFIWKDACQSIEHQIHGILGLKGFFFPDKFFFQLIFFFSNQNNSLRGPTVILSFDFQLEWGRERQNSLKSIS